MLEKTCIICKKEIQGNKIFCSSKCFGLSYESKKIIKICDNCGKEFKKVASDKRVYCSYICRGISNRKRIIKNCKLCNKQFETYPCRDKKAYCSRSCYGESKIKPNEDQKRCVKCGKTKKHINFSNNSWCKKCINVASMASQLTPHGRYKQAMNQARRRKINFSIAYNKYLTLIKLPCHYCGGEISKNSVGLDRKNNLKNYTIKNCVPCCTRCNYVKNWYLTYKEMVWLGQHLKNLDKLNLK